MESGSFSGDDLQFGSPGEDSTFFSVFLRSPLRLTLKHEGAWKFVDPYDAMNNRSSLRLEYSKFFLKYLFLRGEARATGYWKYDHRTRPTDFWHNDRSEPEDAAFGTRIREAYLQGSFGGTSIKAGTQILIWGESDAGALTDEVSPRDNSEIYFISLEESRIGQPMLLLDQYTAFGDWSLFFVPYPAFNENPQPGTAYYLNPFGEAAEVRVEGRDEDDFEYGMRWKKAIGLSDVSVMAASLTDNDRAVRVADDGVLEERTERFTLAGLALNYPFGNFLPKAEAALKFEKPFTDASLRITKRNAFGASLGFDYSTGGTFTFGMEAVHNRVLDWDEDLQGIPEDGTWSFVTFLGDRFLNETLSLNWLTRFLANDPSVVSIGTAAYQVNDYASVALEAYYPWVHDRFSAMWPYRNQKQILLKLQLQF